MSLLRIGSRGSAVKSFQNDIIQLGFGQYLDRFGADGIFGKASEKATKKLQKFVGAKVDGIVGKETRNKVAQAKANAGKNGTRHFKPREFRCKGSGTLPKGGMDSELILKLEVLRYRLGNKALIINSGYRSESHNRRVGGAPKSLHLYGKAADIRVVGVSASRVYQEADKLFSNGGVGRYSTFTHVDTRNGKARF